MTNITTWNKKKSQKTNLLKSIEELLKKPRLQASRLQKRKHAEVNQTVEGALLPWNREWGHLPT